MKEADIEQFRVILNEMRHELLDDSEMTVHDLQEESTLYPDPSDRASLEEEHINLLRIRDRERKLLSKIEESLEKIDAGTFGICVKCEEDIGMERLKIRPVTNYCIVCKENQEQEEAY